MNKKIQFEKIIKRYEGSEPRKSENGLTTQIRCPHPEHEDDNPSCSMTLTKDKKKILFYCHSKGCQNIKSHAFREMGFKKNNRKQGKFIILREHQYFDKQGFPLTKKTKGYYEEEGIKTAQFRQSYFDTQQNRYVGKAHPKKVLYNLNYLENYRTKKPNKFVFIVEGEKDCDALSQVGLLSTTSPDGAGSNTAQNKWLDDYTETLRGRSVVIIPDNDTVGIQHAEITALRLYGIAKKVRLLPPISKKDKGDISDWFESEEGSLTKLMKRVKACELFNPSDAQNYENIKVVKKEQKEKKKKERKQKQIEDSLISKTIGHALLPSEVGDFTRFMQVSDSALAHTFYEDYKDFLVCVRETNDWLLYDKNTGLWAGERREALQTCILEYYRKVYDLLESLWDGVDIPEGDAGQVERELKNKCLARARQLGNNRGLNTLYGFLEDSNKTKISLLDFNQRRDKLCVKNGVICLKTKKILPHSPEFKFTKRIDFNYDSKNQSPKFEQFLKDIYEGDSRVIDSCKAVFGYMTTGETREQKIFEYYGREGRNGKSTLLEVIRGVLQDYVGELGSDVMAKHKNSTELSAAQLSSLFSLIGCRVAICDETEDARPISTRLIKIISDGSPMKLRKLYKDPITVNLLVKALFQTNHATTMPSTDKAAWRRIVRFTFPRKFEGGDDKKSYYEELLKEREGILAMFIEQAHLYYTKRELKIDPIIYEATEQGRKEQDWLGEFFELFLDVNIKGVVHQNGDLRPVKTLTREVFKVFDAWNLAVGNKRLKLTALSREMAKRGYRVEPSNGERFYIGISLRKDFRETLDKFDNRSMNTLSLLEEIEQS